MKHTAGLRFENYFGRNRKRKSRIEPQSKASVQNGTTTGKGHRVRPKIRREDLVIGGFKRIILGVDMLVERGCVVCGLSLIHI